MAGNNIYGQNQVEEVVKVWANLEKIVTQNVEILEKYSKNAASLPSEYVKQLQETRKAQEALNKAIEEAKNKQTEYTNLKKAEERQLKKIAKTKADLEVSNSKEADSYHKINEQLKQNRKEQRQSAKATIDFKNAYDKLNNELAEAERRYKHLAASQGLSNKKTKEAEKEVKRLRKQVDGINKPIKRFGDNVGNYPRQMSGALNVVKGLIGAFGVIEGLRFGLNFAKESVVLAREARGVEFAFKNIGVEAQIAFEKVRRSTRGLLSDLDIKKSIVEFDNFNLEVEQLDTVLEFVAVRAAQTGKSFEYLRDSAIEAISKESVRRADNLGLSQKELNDRIKEGSTFLEAFTDIAKREIGEAGDVIDEAANSQQKFNAAFENFKVSAGSGFIGKLTNDVYDLGTAFISTFSDINDASEGFWDFLGNIARASDPISGGIQRQMIKVEAEMQRELKKREPLVDRIIEQQRERGLSDQQLITNRKSLLKLYSTQLQAILKDTEATSKNNKEKEKDVKITREKLETISSLEKKTQDYVGKIKEQIKLLENTRNMYQENSQESKYLTENIERLKQALEGDSLEDSASSHMDNWIKEYENKQLQLVDIHKKYADQRKEIERELSDNLKELGLSVTDALIQNQLNRLDREAELNRERAEDALLFANGNREAELQIREQFEERQEEIEKKRLKAERKAFILEQAFKAGEIAIETIKSVAAIKAQAAVLLANPLTAPLAGLALSQIPLVIATGATAGAAVLAQSIPQFKDGVRDFSGGLAVVGDGGVSEIVTTPKGEVFKTPNKDTLVNLPKGANVYKNQLDFNKELETMLDLNGVMPFRDSMMHPNLPMIKVENNGVNAAQMDAIIGKHFSNIKTQNTIIDKNGIKTFISQGASRTVDLNNRVTFKGKSV